MKPIHRRIISALIAMVTSLSAVASTLPPDAHLSSIPMLAWLLAVLAGLTGFYSPKEPVVDLEVKEIKAP
jgi:hypothetical protein